MIFIDSSASYALANDKDRNHLRASRGLQSALASREPLMTHNYVISECASLIQRRLGLQAALAYLKGTQLLLVHWVTRGEHERAVELLDQRARRGLSLVDCVSFVVMRELGVSTALAYDSDFEREGFSVLGGSS